MRRIFYSLLIFGDLSSIRSTMLQNYFRNINKPSCSIMLIMLQLGYTYRYTIRHQIKASNHIMIYREPFVFLRVGGPYVFLCLYNVQNKERICAKCYWWLSDQPPISTITCEYFVTSTEETATCDSFANNRSIKK